MTMIDTTLTRRLLLMALTVISSGLASSSAAAAESDPLDWANWRGPELNGVSRETGLVDVIDLTDDPIICDDFVIVQRHTRNQPGTPAAAQRQGALLTRYT